jgi:hypothetical protein
VWSAQPACEAAQPARWICAAMPGGPARPVPFLPCSPLPSPPPPSGSVQGRERQRCQPPSMGSSLHPWEKGSEGESRGAAMPGGPARSVPFLPCSPLPSPPPPSGSVQGRERQRCQPPPSRESSLHPWEKGPEGEVGGVNRVESLGSARLRFCCKPIHIVFVCMRCVWLQVGPCFLCQELQPKLLDMNETGLAQQIDMAWLLGEEYGYLSVHHSAHRVCPPSKIFFLKKTLTMLHIGFCQIAR